MRAVRSLRSSPGPASSSSSRDPAPSHLPRPILSDGQLHPSLQIGTRVIHLEHGLGTLLGWKHAGVEKGDILEGLRSDGFVRIKFPSYRSNLPANEVGFAYEAPCFTVGQCVKVFDVEQQDAMAIFKPSSACWKSGMEKCLGHFGIVQDVHPASCTVSSNGCSYDWLHVMLDSADEDSVAVRVIGAGGRGGATNGFYHYAGYHMQRPYYQLQEGNSIIYFDGRWKISDRGSKSGWIYSHPDDSQPTAPKGRWTTDGYSRGDADPAPQIFSFKAGSKVKFVKADSEVDWADCPGEHLPFSRNVVTTIFGIRRLYFRSSSPLLWAPLRAIQMVQVDSEDECEEDAYEQEGMVCEEDGGYDEEFVNPDLAEDFKCAVCMLIARDATCHPCGAIFCNSCWVRWLRQGKNCPSCRQDGAGDPAHRDRRNILNLIIKCQEGCPMTFRLGDKKRHLRTDCVHRAISCPDCGSKTTLHFLPEHRASECSGTWCAVCEEHVGDTDMAAHIKAFADTHIVALLEENRTLKQEINKLRSGS